MSSSEFKCNSEEPSTIKSIEPSNIQNTSNRSKQSDKQTKIEKQSKSRKGKKHSKIGRWYLGEHLGKGQYSWVRKGYDKKELLRQINDDEKMKKFLKDKDIENIIFIKDKLINLIMNN